MSLLAGYFTGGLLGLTSLTSLLAGYFTGGLLGLTLLTSLLAGYFTGDLLWLASMMSLPGLLNFFVVFSLSLHNGFRVEV